jgi:hypothetical protein
MRFPIRLFLPVFAAMLVAPVVFAANVAQKSFATPEEGAAALFAAVKANDVAAIRAVLGPQGSKLIQSGDKVSDEQRHKRFVAAYTEANRLALEGEAKAVLVIGKDDWPMPIPLVKSGKRWRFDTLAGKDEVLKRRIGRNELSAIQVCLSVVDAEREYVAKDRDSDGLMEYAAKIASTPGKRDGLFWEARDGEPASPLGPLVAAAAAEGYGKSGMQPLSPYHGYYYRILTRQGKAAKGGELDYRVKGQLIGGFALVAYPARYGASGVMTFVANHDGIVFQKDLGPNTAALAAKISAFDPDATWKPAKPVAVSAEAAK